MGIIETTRIVCDYHECTNRTIIECEENQFSEKLSRRGWVTSMKPHGTDYFCPEHAEVVE